MKTSVLLGLDFSTTNVNSILIINDNKKLPYDTKNEIRYTITDEHNYT